MRVYLRAMQTNSPLPVAAIIPSYNPGHRLAPVVEAAAQQAAKVLVVDDGSTDGSAAELQGAEIVRLPENLGKGHALLAGLRAFLDQPDYSCVAFLDADGQHDPAELPRLYEAFVQQDADLLIGTRVFEGTEVPWASRFGNNMTVRVTAWILERRLPDTQCGYRLMSRRFAEAVLRDVRGGRYETEMEIVVKAVREGWRVHSEPIKTLYEPDNRSSHFRKVRDSFRIYWTLLKLARGK